PSMVSVVGDFTGDGRTDLAQYDPATARWWVTTPTTGGTMTRLWAQFPTVTGWQKVVVGDFNGDGKADIASLNFDGSWWVGLSTGSSFNISYWGQLGTASGTALGWQEHLVGDFDGDGRADIASYRATDGTWWVSQSNGAAFGTHLWMQLPTQ